MNNRTLKILVSAALFGAILYFTPAAFIKGVLAIVVFGMMIFALWRSSGRRSKRWKMKMAFADHMRNMDDESYAAFKSKFREHCRSARNVNFEEESNEMRSKSSEETTKE